MCTNLIPLVELGMMHEPWGRLLSIHCSSEWITSHMLASVPGTDCRIQDESVDQINAADRDCSSVQSCVQSRQRHWSERPLTAESTMKFLALIVPRTQMRDWRHFDHGCMSYLILLGLKQKIRQMTSWLVLRQTSFLCYCKLLASYSILKYSEID